MQAAIFKAGATRERRLKETKTSSELHPENLRATTTRTGDAAIDGMPNDYRIKLGLHLEALSRACLGLLAWLLSVC